MTNTTNTTKGKKVTEKELMQWKEFLFLGTMNGKELTDKDIEKVKKIGKKEVTLEAVADMMETQAQLAQLEQRATLNQLASLIDVSLILLTEKLGITQEDIEEAHAIRGKKIEEQKAKQEKQQEEVLEEKTKEESTDKKVVKFPGSK